MNLGLCVCHAEPFAESEPADTACANRRPATGDSAAGRARTPGCRIRLFVTRNRLQAFTNDWNCSDAGTTQTLGDLMDVKQVIGVRQRRAVLERKNAGIDGALECCGKRQQVNNIGAFAGGDFSEKSLKQLVW